MSKLSLVLACCITRAVLGQTPADTNWRALYLKDLSAARAIIDANHPGVLDAQHPEFARTLRVAYDEARRDSSAVAAYSSYSIALRRFGNRFQDGHLSIGGTRRAPVQRDAGLFPIWRQGAFIIEAVDGRYGADTLRLRGAAILSCDGRGAADVFRTRVLSWLGREEISADWYRFAPYYFLDYGPPLAAAPTGCRVRTPAGERDVPLRWQAVSASLNQLFRQAAGGVPRRLAVDDIPDGRGVWVAIGTFATGSDSLVAAMRGMLDSLRARLARETTPGLIVLDLRGNDGGNSTWGDEVAQVLFGKPWFNEAKAWLGDGVYVEWRVSRDNVAAIDGQARDAERRAGVESNAAKSLRRVHAGLSEALARGAPYWSQPSARSGVKRPSAASRAPSVVVVTDAQCFSACLDFMDLLRLHPSVTHAGITTGVDTEFMENWGQTLPSGLAQVGYPMKVYRNRRRAHNEAYSPQIPFEGPIGDTAALRAWILSLGRH